MPTISQVSQFDLSNDNWLPAFFVERFINVTPWLNVQTTARATWQNFCPDHETEKSLSKTGSMVQTMVFDNSAFKSWMKNKAYPFLLKNKCLQRDATRQSTHLDLGTNGGQAHNSRLDISILILSWYARTFNKETNAPLAFIYNLFGTLTNIIENFFAHLFGMKWTMNIWMVLLERSIHLIELKLSGWWLFGLE